MGAQPLPPNFNEDVQRSYLYGHIISHIWSYWGWEQHGLPNPFFSPISDDGSCRWSITSLESLSTVPWAPMVVITSPSSKRAGDQRNNGTWPMTTIPAACVGRRSYVKSRSCSSAMPSYFCHLLSRCFMILSARSFQYIYRPYTWNDDEDDDWTMIDNFELRDTTNQFSRWGRVIKVVNIMKHMPSITHHQWWKQNTL